MVCNFEFLYYMHHEQHTLVEKHTHNCYELVYYLNGSGSVTIDDISYPYSKNTFSISTPEEYHLEEHDEPTDVFFIGFTFQSNTLEFKNGLYFDSVENTFLKLLENMKQELFSRKALYSTMLDVLVKELSIEYSRILIPMEFNLPKNLPYIERLINENLSQDINVKTLAKLSGYSYDHFRHLFKKEIGCSPINYIINKRIEKSKQLLTTLDCKISNIAYQCGFSSESFFCSIFKRHTGLTPKEFRRNNL